MLLYWVVSSFFSVRICPSKVTESIVMWNILPRFWNTKQANHDHALEIAQQGVMMSVCVKEFLAWIPTGFLCWGKNVSNASQHTPQSNGRLFVFGGHVTLFWWNIRWKVNHKLFLSSIFSITSYFLYTRSNNGKSRVIQTNSGSLKSKQAIKVAKQEANLTGNCIIAQRPQGGAR